ncbi:RWP-RK domain [Phytophthora cactorum]|nr:RWP-RK domain [Phytophthora cactorum]
MAAEMEQHRAPELAVTESGPRVAPSVSSSMMKPPYTMDENKPVAPTDVSKSGLTWPDPSLQPLRTKPTTPGGSSLKVETSPTIVHTNSTGATLDESGLPKPSDGLPVPSMSCDSVSPVSPTVMKDLQFDSRFISDAWSYEAPQNMYALLTQPTNQMDPLAGGTGLVTPYMQLQAQQQHLQMQQQQLEQQLEHGLPLQMSPIHGSGLSSLFMSGAPMAISPHQMMMQPPNAPGMNPGYPSTPTAVTLSDIMISGDPSMFLAPSGSPTNMVKQQMMPPMPHAGGVINVKDLTLNELRPHFNKPMAVVAKELGVCITLMKKICRRNGLVRWPHRPVIQNPNEKSRKAQTDTKIPSKTEEMILREVSNEFPIAQITDEMVGPAEIPVDDESNDNDIHQTGTGAAKKSKKKKLTTPKTETKEASA